MKILKKVLKGAGLVLGGLLLLVLPGYGVIHWLIEQRLDKTYSLPEASLAIPTDSASLAQGAHIAKIKGCQDCHGEQMAGKIVMDDPAVGRFVGSNLTRGRGGLPAGYRTADWIRALQHGVGIDGRPLIVMPSQETSKMSDQDISAVIAYCESLPAVDHELSGSTIGPLGRILLAFDKIPLLSAELIDHQAKPVAQMTPAVNEAYGAYLAVSCSGCHGSGFKGGEAPIPGMKPIPDITATGNPGRWTEAQFIHTLRTGRTPEGKQLLNEDMPWRMTRQYTDLELKALRLYLLSRDKQTALR